MTIASSPHGRDLLLPPPSLPAHYFVGYLSSVYSPDGSEVAIDNGESSVTISTFRMFLPFIFVHLITIDGV